MSSTPNLVPWYRRELWLTVAIASFILITLSLFLPQSLRLVPLSLAGVLMAVSLVMVLLRARRVPQRELTRGLADEPSASA